MPTCLNKRSSISKTVTTIEVVQSVSVCCRVCVWNGKREEGIGVGVTRTHGLRHTRTRLMHARTRTHPVEASIPNPLVQVQVSSVLDNVPAVVLIANAWVGVGWEQRHVTR